MSSGLAENNAFTTTLVLRTLGFLVESKAVLPGIADAKDAKLWELYLTIRDFPRLAAKLTAKADLLSKFLFDLFPRSVQKQLVDFVSSGKREKEVQNQVVSELGRVIRTTNLYDPQRFNAITLSDETKGLLSKPLDGYSVAHLNRLLLHDFYSTEIAPLGQTSLHHIAESISEHPSRFQINEYPPAAAVIYWFVDGIDRAKIDLPPTHWDRLCDWAREEFGRQRSLVVAKHAAMMDPVAMAMSACLCARLRAISKKADRGTTNALQAKLPSILELECSVIELFAEQTKSGIWPKYFPLFHYQEAGSNFCFTFELLEAVLTEFGDRHNTLITHPSFIAGLEDTVTWCEHNRLRYSENKNNKSTSYTGWNSGGFLETLRRGQPESWATAVVHMFLWELVDGLSRHIQYHLLDKYQATSPTETWKKVNELLDIDLWMEGEHKSLKTMLAKTIIKSFGGTTSLQLRRRQTKNVPLSALLFGPPGTSKTAVTKAVAADLGWPVVEIDPSHFLQSSFQNIYVQAEKIFDDVMDLSGVVVLFDEMDALVQKRDGETTVDTESKFLTTYMLPKLAKLHDRGRVVFFMATNFQANFDDAIKRAGRFDFLFCMGPPTLEAKCEAIHSFYGKAEEPTLETQRAGKSIRKFCDGDNWLKQQLELYTFDEFQSFITGVAEKSNIGGKIDSLEMKGLIEAVKEDSKSVSLKLDDLEPIMQK